MKSHEIDYEIIGDDIQLIEIELDPQETVIAEAGAMNYLEEGISFEAKMGDGSSDGEGVMGLLKNVGKQVLSGESIFMIDHPIIHKDKHSLTRAEPTTGSKLQSKRSRQRAFPVRPAVENTGPRNGGHHEPRARGRPRRHRRPRFQRTHRRLGAPIR